MLYKQYLHRYNAPISDAVCCGMSVFYVFFNVFHFLTYLELLKYSNIQALSFQVQNLEVESIQSLL